MSGADVQSQQPDQLRQTICDIGWRLWTRGLCSGSDGNISVRLSEGEYLCTPSNRSKGFLSPGNLCRIDSAGRPLERGIRPSSEIRMHLAIYEERPDVSAIIHAHPPHATGFALAHRLPPHWVYAEADVLLHPIALVPYVTPGDQRLADAVRPHARKSDVLLLANHGAVCMDADLEQAYFKMEMLETFVRIVLAAEGAGGAKQLVSSDQAELLRLRQKLRGQRFDPPG
ncbi:MAG: class II aldolase/adducin family protein [Phycisphaerae bacterium]|nr:class II aldolase/adducin family protein [Phycisphaerae bacterium]MDW8262029.1 class II aldolase/adducin family protein [Phycisphaerales bacterium]